MHEPDDLQAALLDEADLHAERQPAEAPPADVDHASTTANRVGRRGLVTGLGIGGIAVAAGAVGSIAASRVAAAEGYRRQQFTVDIACLGPTEQRLVRDWAGQQPNETFPGHSFSIEGWIYPAFTIPGDGFEPVEEGSIGRWFCRGSFVNSEKRPEPHVNTSVDLAFGRIGGDAVVPFDLIALQGPEGTGHKDRFILRPVTGGAGKYLGASGQIKQWYIGDNTTASPNWRYEIDIRVWD